MVNPRHAAALAFVGWYLMVPAPGLENRPLSYWSHMGSYDTAKECEQGMRGWYKLNEQDGFAMKKYTAAQVKNAWLLAECIEADDPRLKER